MIGKALLALATLNFIVMMFVVPDWSAGWSWRYLYGVGSLMIWLGVMAASMKTLVGSPPPEEPEDDGPVYVFTTLGRSDAFVTTGYNTITVTPALTNATTIWVSGG
jgi:hypothetical protein